MDGRVRVEERAPGGIDRPGAGAAPKPLLRGWLHAAAALAAIVFTAVICWRSRADVPRLVSLLIFGLSMVELYGVSATYHIGRWTGATRRRLRALDHANIFVQIAGTYTPLCFNVLAGPARPAILAAIWALAAGGVSSATLTPHAPRWLRVGLYVAMGWVAVLVLPAFLSALPWQATAGLAAGGLLYTLGALVYALRWPDPFPRVLGFHEIFHAFVVAGGVTFATVVWVWVLPFPRA